MVQGVKQRIRFLENREIARNLRSLYAYTLEQEGLSKRTEPRQSPILQSQRLHTWTPKLDIILMMNWLSRG
ncbi:hypothetical protein GF326_02250 [Candidatus Bathyarchaeota archaeon]|nr:hypothetical protein [Candidatus Bathyarchaeota archaeon]